MGKYIDYLKMMWQDGAERGKSMKQQDKEMVKKVFKKKGKEKS